MVFNGTGPHGHAGEVHGHSQGRLSRRWILAQNATSQLFLGCSSTADYTRRYQKMSSTIQADHSQGQANPETSGAAISAKIRSHIASREVQRLPLSAGRPPRGDGNQRIVTDGTANAREL